MMKALIILILVISFVCCDHAHSQSEPGLGWTPGAGEPRILPDAAYKLAKEAIEREYPKKGDTGWQFVGLSIGASYWKRVPSTLYLAYTLKFHRKDLAHDLWTYCDVEITLDDSKVIVGSIYNK